MWQLLMVLKGSIVSDCALPPNVVRLHTQNVNKNSSMALMVTPRFPKQVISSVKALQ